MTALALLAALLQAKDNPDYRAWTGFGPGSWVKLVMESAPGGRKTLREDIVRLVRLTPEQAVVERQTRTTADGRSVPQAPYLETIPAKRDRLDEILREGEEEIEVAGRRLRCRVLELERMLDGQKKRVKLWASDEVPGGAVRMELRAPGAESPELTLRAEGWKKQ